MPPGRKDKKIRASVAAKKAVGASRVAVDTWAPHGRADGKRVTPVVAQKAVEAFLAVVDAGLPILKICRKRETPVAAQEAGGTTPAAVSAEAPPGREEEKMASPDEMTRKGRPTWSQWLPRRCPRCPQQQWKLRRPLVQMT